MWHIQKWSRLASSRAWHPRSRPPRRKKVLVDQVYNEVQVEALRVEFPELGPCVRQAYLVRNHDMEASRALLEKVQSFRYEQGWEMDIQEEHVCRSMVDLVLMREWSPLILQSKTPLCRYSSCIVDVFFYPDQGHLQRSFRNMHNGLYSTSRLASRTKNTNSGLQAYFKAVRKSLHV